MSQFRITGGRRLEGEIRVAGNKNAVLPLMAAALAIDGQVTLTNVPIIRDVAVMSEIFAGLGVRVEGTGSNTLTIDASEIFSFEPDPTLVGKFRGSILLVAPLLLRFGKAKMVTPGGDSIGERLLDTHFELLEAFGTTVRQVKNGHLAGKNVAYEFTADRLQPTDLFLPKASVTATEIGLIMAAGLPGKTVIEDAAAEPHVTDVADFLAKAGAMVVGAGTNTVVVQGKEQLKPVEHRVREDHIEVGTFAIAAAVTGGEIRIRGAREEDLKMILYYLSNMNVHYKWEDDLLYVMPSELEAKLKLFQTRPWPGFPTDLMSHFIVLASQTKGTVLCHDWMYEWRIFFVDHLISMGADITIADPHRIIVTGPRQLHGDVIPTNDIRAGSALVLAALCARGESTIEHAEIIERGYEHLEERLRAVGADITKIE